MKKAITILALIAASVLTCWSQAGSGLFKAKCAMCHGAQGQGKIAPKIAGTAKTEEQIVALLTKGGAPKGIHVKPMAGMDAVQAKTIAAFVKTLK